LKHKGLPAFQWLLTVAILKVLPVTLSLMPDQVQNSGDRQSAATVWLKADR
jgi:hypothetical protein